MTKFFDVDGKMYPCSFTAPMTFLEHDLNNILKTDFENDNNFVDDDCFEKCYIYPICSTCTGSDYLVNKSFKQRDKRKCQLQKLTALFTADLLAKRIQKNQKYFDGAKLYYTIEAIKKIRGLYLDEFKKYLY
jgi:radical SAM protein with 4Fe4S-binding SPASM domain